MHRLGLECSQGKLGAILENGLRVTTVPKHHIWKSQLALHLQQIKYTTGWGIVAKVISGGGCASSTAAGPASTHDHTENNICMQLIDGDIHVMNPSLNPFYVFFQIMEGISKTLENKCTAALLSQDKSLSFRHRARWKYLNYKEKTFFSLVTSSLR